MSGSADLFEWAKKTEKAKRRSPRPSGFYSALALVVKYGKLAEERRGVRELKARRAPAQVSLRKAETAPAKSTCPRCGHVGPVDQDFGSRRLKGELRPQSWCRKCRAAANRSRRAPEAKEAPLTGTLL